MIEIPYQQLSPEGLQGVLEEFASRDGTEFTPLETKTKQLMTQLRAGKLKIIFDAIEGSCQLIRSEDFSEDLLPPDQESLD